jgi:anti-sigma factor RsiW
MVREDGNLSDAEIAELAAFADGSLPARRRRKVAAAVERSPELRAALADCGPSAPAPRPERKEPNLLAASVDGVAFPDYLEMFGWRASGERADDLDDRATRTVYYERARNRVAYTIVSGDQLEWPPDWKQTRRDGVQLRSTERDGTTTVTWLREGRTCVLSGADVPREELLALAAWKGEGTVSF